MGFNCEILTKWEDIQTEVIFFLSSLTLKLCRSQNLSSNIVAQAVTFLLSNTTPKKKKSVNLKHTYEIAPQTSDNIMEIITYISSSNTFICLESEIDFLMGDSEDAKIRINAVSKSMGVLKFILDDCSVSIETNIKLFSAISLILLL